MKKNNCLICGIFQKDGWEIENSKNEPYNDKFPKNLNSLTIIKQSISWGISALYQCPECKTYFLRIIKDEFDYFAEEMLTVEKLYPITDENAQEIIYPKHQKPQFVEINISLRCSKCNSKNIEKLREMNVKDDILIWYKCQNCGNEEFMDYYNTD
ncbi:MAG: hypothetical protein A2Y34_11710 [Spirochaetes bacterium GWC1_27_15]|nr:MAG: hypothetical protein A2Z98_12715 [Spirochaetes bacterium GWB1_27_13]OHD26668.1 MAG: hypothetical protein A2Y34_11710 [Spirochaetes bacterium GWC1_27_15]